MNKTWVLMRGLGRESGHWGPFVETMRQALSPDQVMTVDHPGMGRQLQRAVPHSISAMAEAARTQVPRGNGAAYILFGHSLGGMVALDWAARYPQEVVGVVLINTSSSDTSPWDERLTLSALHKMGKILLESSENEREQEILNLVSRVPDRHPTILNEWVQIARERPVSKTVLARQLWAASRFKLTKMMEQKRPILCLGSMGDELVNPACSERLARTLKAQLALHPWAGHEVTLDDPEWVQTQVQNWCKML